MQGGHADVGSAHEHRFEHRERCRTTCAPDADHDVFEDGHLLFGREFVGDRPSRRARREAHLCALAKIVDLHDDSVDVVAQSVASRFHLFAALVHAGEIVEHLDLRIDRKAKFAQPGQGVFMRTQPWPSNNGAYLIAEQRQVT